MRGFDDNDCRLCKTTFCCPKCRLKHEINVHEIFPDCNLCIYGLSEREDLVKETQLEHLEKTHLPVNCIYCRKVFSSVAEIQQHRKCPVLQKKNDLANTPFKVATSIDTDEEAQDSPILQELQRNELLSYKFNLATSTPMPRLQEPTTFSKNNIQFDIEKSSQVINKSIIKKMDSLVDSVKDSDHSSKRRVTFGSSKLIDSESRDKTNNTPVYSKEKTYCSPVTPANSKQSEYFFSAKSEITDSVSPRPSAYEGLTPAASMKNKKEVPGKAHPQKENVPDGVSDPEKNITEESAPTIKTEIKGEVITGEYELLKKKVPGAEDSPIYSAEHVDVLKPMAEIKDETKDDTIEENVPGVKDTGILYSAGDTVNIITEVSIVDKANEQRESSQADQQDSSGKIISNSPVTPATGIEIEQFYSAKSEFNKASSTPGFFRRRVHLSKRFAPEMPQIQSNLTAQENINVLSDLHASNVSLQKTSSASTSKHENLNISDLNEVSMELDCSWNKEPISIVSPLSASDITKSVPSPSPSKINDQQKCDTNLSISGNTNNITEVSTGKIPTIANEPRGSSETDQQTFTSNSPVTPATGIELDQFYSAKTEVNKYPSTPGIFGRRRQLLSERFALDKVDVPQIQSTVTAQEDINALRELHTPNVSVQKTFSVKDENLNISDQNEVSMELTHNSSVSDKNHQICSPLSVTDITNSSPTKINDQSEKGDTNLSIPVNVPQIQSNVKDLENINNLSDLHAFNVSVQKIFSAATSNDEILNISNLNELSMELTCAQRELFCDLSEVSMELTYSWVSGNNEPICPPVSVANITKSSLTKIIDQSEKGDTNLSIPANVPQIQFNVTDPENIDTSRDLHAPIVSVPKISNDTISKDENLNISNLNEVSMQLTCSWVSDNNEAIWSSLSLTDINKSSPTNISDQLEKGDTNLSIPAVNVPQIQLNVTDLGNINNLSDLHAPNVSEQKIFSSATATDENLNISDLNEVSMELDCSWVSDNNEAIWFLPSLTDITKSSPTKISDHSDKGDTNLPIPAGSKNNEECAPSRADQYNSPVKVDESQPIKILITKSTNEDNIEPTHDIQIKDISHKLLSRSAGFLNNTYNEENDENTPPNIKVPRQKNKESVNAPAKSSTLRSDDRTYFHDTKETKISNTTDSPAEPKVTTVSTPTPVCNKTDVPKSFNFPNHFASTPRIHKSAKIKQINIADEISKIPKDLLSSDTDTSLPKNYSSEETNQCKDPTISDSKPEPNNESSHAFVSVSSMTESNLWTTMTRIVKSVFGGLNNRSEDNSINTSSPNLRRISFKRLRSDTDLDTNCDSTPRFKRYKFSDIKCRRPIREPLELPSRIGQSSNRVATLEMVTVRTVYEAGPRCKTMWDKATQTDDYLMDGWHPQPK